MATELSSESLPSACEDFFSRRKRGSEVIGEVEMWSVTKQERLHLFPIRPVDAVPLRGVGVEDVEVHYIDPTGEAAL